MDDSVHRSDQKLEILFVTSDLFPPFRPAAKAVFAEGLAARGHRIDRHNDTQDGDQDDQRIHGAPAFSGRLKEPFRALGILD